MVLDHILHTAVSPVLVLLEIGHEAGACDSGEPAGGDPLHRTAKQQGRQIHAQFSKSLLDSASAPAAASGLATTLMPLTVATKK